MSPRARGARLALLVIVPGGWLAAASCTGDEDAGGAGGAGGTTASTTTTTSSTSSTTSTGGGSACPPLAFPPEVPAGWSELTDWSCDCRFYYPPTPELMPAPIAWEPCPAALGSVDCRKMVVDWTPAHAFAIYSQAPLYVHDDGTPTLMFRRISERWITDMIADADGPVRMAVMRVRGSQETAGGSGAGCSLGSPGYRWPRFALGVQGHDSEGDWLTSPHQGALAGTVDSPKPEVFRHYTDGRVRSWFMSADYIAWGNSTDFKVVASPWDETEIDVTSPPDDPDHLHANQVRWWKDALFWKTNGGSISGINVWTAQAGARPFIRWVGDDTRGAADLGTDGTDLVWAYGEGGVLPGTITYVTRSIMTAPFTTDGATALANARRLRSEPDKCVGCDHFEVGCGYAAHRGAPSVLVVRLSDGWSWRVPEVWPDNSPENALGITCDEVFVGGKIDGIYNIARIRLDSLGPGMAPD